MITHTGSLRAQPRHAGLQLLSLGLAAFLIMASRTTDAVAQEDGRQLRLHPGLEAMDTADAKQAGARKKKHGPRDRTERWLRTLTEEQQQEIMQRLHALPGEQRGRLLRKLRKMSPEERLEFLRDHHEVSEKVGEADTAEHQRMRRHHRHFRELLREYQESLTAEERAALEQLPERERKRRFRVWAERRKYVDGLDATGRERFAALTPEAQAREIRTWADQRKQRWRQARKQYVRGLSPEERRRFEALPERQKWHRMREWRRQRDTQPDGKLRGGRGQRGKQDARQRHFRELRMEYVQSLTPEERQQFVELNEAEQRRRLRDWRRERRTLERGARTREGSGGRQGPPPGRERRQRR